MTKARRGGKAGRGRSKGRTFIWMMMLMFVSWSRCLNLIFSSFFPLTLMLLFVVNSLRFYWCLLLYTNLYLSISFSLFFLSFFSFYLVFVFVFVLLPTSVVAATTNCSSTDWLPVLIPTHLILHTYLRTNTPLWLLLPALNTVPLTSYHHYDRSTFTTANTTTNTSTYSNA